MPPAIRLYREAVQRHVLPSSYIEKLCNVMSSRLTCCIVRGHPLVLAYDHQCRDPDPNDVSLSYPATFVGSRTSSLARSAEDTLCTPSAVEESNPLRTEPYASPCALGRVAHCSGRNLASHYWLIHHSTR